MMTTTTTIPGDTLPANETVDELLEQVHRGDAEALDLLLRRILPPLTRWASGRLPPHARERMDTDDLVQESVMSVLRRIHDFEAPNMEAFRAYLRVAVKNKIRDELRRVARLGVPEELPEETDGHRPTPLDLAVEREAAERYEQALESLPPSDRVAVVLRVEFHHSFGEIAVGLGKPSADAARMTVSRALKKLEAAMRPSSPR